MARRPTDRPACGGTYLLTWTTFGSWLPGDRRGFVSWLRDRTEGGWIVHNIPGEPYDFDEPDLEGFAANLRNGPVVVLTERHAAICANAFVETGQRHGVDIHAGAVMASHVHLVVRSETHDGSRLLNLFKGVSSRRLGQEFGVRPGGSWWTRHGSRRLLPDGRAIAAAVAYVLNQPSPLKVFEHEVHVRCGPEPPRVVPEPPRLRGG